MPRNNDYKNTKQMECPRTKWKDLGIQTANKYLYLPLRLGSMREMKNQKKRRK